MRPSSANACFTGTGLLSRNSAAVSCADRARQALRPHRLSVLPRQVHVAAETGRNVRGDRDAAVAALSKIGQRQRVVSAEQTEIRADQRPQARRPRRIAGGIFEADHSAATRPGGPQSRRQARTRFATERHRGSAASRSIGDRAEMGVKPRLCRFVVVRHHRQNRVRAGRFCVSGQFDGMGRRIRAGSGDDRNPAARPRSRDANESYAPCGLNVGASPVVPHTTSAVAPWRAADRTIARTRGVDASRIVERCRQRRSVSRQFGNMPADGGHCGFSGDPSPSRRFASLSRAGAVHCDLCRARNRRNHHHGLRLKSVLDRTNAAPHRDHKKPPRVPLWS